MAAASALGLTPRMRDCYRAIERHIAAHGHAPSFDELRIALGYGSKATIARLIDSLQARGWITYDSKRKRSIAIVPGADAAPAYALPRRVQDKLRMHCLMRGESPADIVADAVLQFLGAIEAEERAAA